MNQYRLEIFMSSIWDVISTLRKGFGATSPTII